jgi:hypothetical protein
MDTVRVWGASDDLIEVDGALCEEFGAFDEEEGVVLAFSDGTVLHVRYDSEGCWRVGRLVAGAAAFEHTPATGPDDDYTDRVTLTGDIAWCVKGSRLVRRATAKVAR